VRSSFRSKRRIVGPVGLRSRLRRGRCRPCLRRCGLALRRLIAGGSRGTAVVSTAKHLQIFGYHPQARTLLPTLSIVPGIKVQATLDEDRSAFLEILLRYLGLAAPERDVHKSDLFFLFAAVVFPSTVDGQANVRNCGSFWRVFSFRVTRQISDQ